MLSQLVCGNCGVDFTAYRRDAKWCPACRVLYQRKATKESYRKKQAERVKEPIRLHCMDCGATFEAKRRDTQRCESCKGVRKTKLTQARSRREPRTIRICWVCKQSFEASRRDAVRCDDCKARQEAQKPQRFILSVVTCIDCRTQFQAKRTDTLRCAACAEVHRKQYQREYAHGRVKGQCIDCGAVIGRKAQRCRVCDNKARSVYMQAERVASWKGGKSKTGDYVIIRTDPSKKGSAAYRPEHHVVWERTHGKPLPKGWVVHHLNGVKDDNRPENLAGMSRHEHHHHPREALRPYEARIRQLEQELKAVRQLRFSE